MSAKRANKERRAWRRGASEKSRVQVSLAALSRGHSEQQLEHLKERLLAPILSSIQNSALAAELRWVANEAAGLAWLTVCPLLVLPDLLEEKVRQALIRWEHQQTIRRGRQSARA
jgi:hypothetical protein